MSVFSNIYTSAYEANDATNKYKELVTNFDFFDTFLTTVINTFSWKNLPDPKLPAFMPEYFNQYSGRIARYNDDDGKPKLHAAFPNGQLTDTGEFTSYTIVTPNGKTVLRKAEDIEICFNNCFKMPYVYKINQFAEKMSYALRAVDSALTKACMPVGVLFEDEAQLKAFGKFLDPLTAMKPFVAMLKKKMAQKDVELLNLYEADKIDVLALWDVSVRYRNLFYTTFGINNVEVQKRERLTEAEGAGNDEITRYSLLDDMYRCRKDFVERCKEHFGDEMEVEINRDIATVFQLEATNAEKMALAQLDFTKGTNPANPTQTEKAEDIEDPKEPTVKEEE